MKTQVFKPEDFRLLCPTRTRGADKPTSHTRRESPLVTRCVTAYAPGGRGYSIGDGCYRTGAAHGRGQN